MWTHNRCVMFPGYASEQTFKHNVSTNTCKDPNQWIGTNRRFLHMLPKTHEKQRIDLFLFIHCLLNRIFLLNSTSADFCVNLRTSGSFRAFVAFAKPNRLSFSSLWFSSAGAHLQSRLPLTNPSLFVQLDRLGTLGIRQEQLVDLKPPFTVQDFGVQIPREHLRSYGTGPGMWGRIWAILIPYIPYTCAAIHHHDSQGAARRRSV